MVALIFLGGVSRVLGYPLNWSTDFATAFFAWACFLCADIAWRRNALMSIDFLVNRLPRAQAAVRYANYAIIAGSSFTSWSWAPGSWTSRARSFQGIRDQLPWVTMSLPVGAALLLATTILKFRDDRKRRRRGPT